MRNHSKLLINEPPLIILPTLAVRVGLAEAIFIQQLHYWLEKSRHEKEGHYWVYNTYSEWEEQFPFFSNSTIRRAIKNVEKKGIVIVGNFNTMKIDKTKWYRIDYDVLNEIWEEENTTSDSDSPCGQIEQSMWSEDTIDGVRLSKAIPEITTENVVVVGEDKKAEPEKPKPQVRKQNPFDFFQHNLGVLSPVVAEDLGNWIDDFNGNEDVVIEALKITAEAQKPYHYAKGIMKRWYDRGLRTHAEVISAITEHNREIEKRTGPAKKNNDDFDWDALKAQGREFDGE